MRAAAVSLGLLLAAAPAALAAPPDVVLVTLDTVRADRMGFLGSPRGLTPHLDLLARESVVFEQAYAQAPLTTVSHATILTGTWPPRHRVQDFGLPLPASVPYLPALLAGAGYHTAAFVGSLILDPRGPIAPGFDRGFEVYDAGFRRRRAGEDPYRTKERRGSEVVARALAWLDGRPAGPLFLWVHLYDAHDPYDPPAPFATRFARDPYDGEIAAVDAAVGTLLEGLRARGRLAGAVVVVAADHGESLGEHGEATHGLFLYESDVHVPLLVRLPGAEQGGRRVSARVRLVDVAPTILHAAGLATPAAIQGEALLGLARGKAEAERPAYAESEYPRRVFGWSDLLSWREERFLFVEAPRRELYDLRLDADQARNLAGERAPVAEGMAARMEAARKAWASAGESGPTPAPDAGLVERLASLGYAAAGVAAGPPSGVDPKDKVAVADLVREGGLAAEDGLLDQAIALFERAVATDPQILTARLELGLSLARRQQWARALPHLQAALARMPESADGRFTLGLTLSSMGRPADAMRELRAALEKQPDHYPARLLLGRLLHESGRSAEAIPHLEQAVKSRPDAREAHALLAEAYERVGRGADAARERARARP
jgi:arylsulfatase A-like enzyme